MPLSRREIIDNAYLLTDKPDLQALADRAGLSPDSRAAIAAKGADLVRAVRAADDPGLMEVFLAEYGLSTDEGIALMCLAEALLRVPDAATIDALIEDKIAPSDWGRHLGRSTSSLVNASTWGLLLTGKVLEDSQPGLVGTLRGAVKRLGEPVIRKAVGRAMREMGAQFVLGEDIHAAMKRAGSREAQGYSYSYDMLGEAARTDADARRYQMAYAGAISDIAAACSHGDIRANPGISVKLSALHPRYEAAQHGRVMAELVPRVTALAQLAKSAGMGFNIDAEEADRLSLSLDVIAAVLSEPSLSGWDGFGVVVQAYGPRARHVIDWLHALADQLDRRIMVRLVKGAYWDSEIKRAQVLGLDGFPVFTDKAATDANYLACARQLLDMNDRIYPQFATHNAHTVAAILHMAGDSADFEFQRLHGMGERLHDIVLSQHKTRCRIYAPVGAHRDLLAYLVRRLLENGANSSFVNQIVNPDFPAEQVAADPFAAELADGPPVPAGPDLFAPKRRNSRGFDFTHSPDVAAIEAARAPFQTKAFTATTLTGPTVAVINPANPDDRVGTLRWASPEDVDAALGKARPWDAPADERAAILNRAAALYEDAFGRFYALLTREAGKTIPDCINELREAVDFLRYYASQAADLTHPARGLFTCISPWNFPLAIFTGQIAGALAAGNGVLAKPAEQTGLIADHAVALLHKAGVPDDVLQLLPGDGPGVGARLTSDARIDGVAFTGSTDTARLIRATMAEHLSPAAPLIAETGGLNAMIVDSTALPEQAVRDVVASAFQSAGQRCSALRCLYVQEDIFDDFTAMLKGAMAELSQGDPWPLACDLGPLIDDEAQTGIAAHIDNARRQGRLVAENPAPQAPKGGHFIAPTVIRINGIADLDREIFGPVLHLASFRAQDLDQVLADINATGYGLTFGLHSRIDDRVQAITEALHVGNAYVNRNQIGAVVGSQPFGGEGLSGTGPKAGGPAYLAQFCTDPAPGHTPATAQATTSDPQDVTRILASLTPDPGPLSSRTLPGPTGEMNRLTHHARAPFLCLGPGETTSRAQAEAVRAHGSQAVICPDLPAAALATLPDFGGVLWWGDTDTARDINRALAARPGAILPLLTGQPRAEQVTLERHLCVDTTASGGNTALIAEVARA
ncbi:MAG TPA: bifunctional proline dehydrogenase/L-glutamate gamma-semialdehyde dehydrogenase PutA [Aliiroseovarius sp.]|nr:bifunctional proline dehydrogenase/L-glutamate gamma-semialdehyde dehydrogenase PutA [Aliiroseovarius sp.]